MWFSRKQWIHRSEASCRFVRCVFDMLSECQLIKCHSQNTILSKSIYNSCIRLITQLMNNLNLVTLRIITNQTDFIWLRINRQRTHLYRLTLNKQFDENASYSKTILKTISSFIDQMEIQTIFFLPHVIFELEKLVFKISKHDFDLG